MKTNFWSFSWVAEFFRWCGNFFKSNTDESSLRLNMFMIAAPIGIVLWAVAFFIVYKTVVPIEVVVNGHVSVKYTFQEIPWSALALFISGIVAALVTLWYGKKINKDAENETPAPGEPAQPNKNVNPTETIQP